ncbi:MAG: class I SAM-dependent methyltransferase [Candidatus Roizmanbacteria bacterium]|nr:class I SAM-dependent methyltransferase [Candidatus Roizmanbacteria bacterium]
MDLLIQKQFADYELIDSGDGMRLERYGEYRISRPDPQVLWKPHAPRSEWNNVSALFVGGRWEMRTRMPESWKIQYKDLTFSARLTPFKHTGIFPEQAVMWDWITDIISKGEKKPQILNLFGYTGIGSVAAAKAGGKVTHVDASKPSITWARENMICSGLPSDAIRWILDDAIKFLRREVKRNKKYDAIIMDPPVYGHGPKGEAWDFFKQMPLLLSLAKSLLTDSPLFLLINAYAISASSIMLGNIIEDLMADKKGKVTYGELALEESYGKRLLSTGIYGRWER